LLAAEIRGSLGAPGRLPRACKSKRSGHAGGSASRQGMTVPHCAQDAAVIPLMPPVACRRARTALGHPALS
jgi:hypothetical protein